MFRVNWKAIAFCSCFLIVIATAPHPAAGFTPGNNALDFDGINDYLEVLDPISITGPFTIEAWVRVRDGAGEDLCQQQWYHWLRFRYRWWKLRDVSPFRYF